MKAEIKKKILKSFNEKYGWEYQRCFADAEELSSSLTTLIIKWLEERKITLKKLKSKPCPYSKIDCCTMQDYSRNQLITELIGEVR